MEAPNYRHIDPPDCCAMCMYFRRTPKGERECYLHRGVEMYDFVGYGGDKPAHYICDDFDTDTAASDERN